jgi:dynein heavy chain
LNADLTYRLKESLEMIDTLLETRPKDAGGGGGPTREELVIEKCKEIIAKLPGNYNMLEVRETLKKTGPPRGLTDKGLSIPLVTFLF